MPTETPILSEHNKVEYQPMNNGEFDKSPTITFEQGYAIRGIAMIIIIFVHSINEYECYNSALSNMLLIPYFGVFACSIFFFMSGYGVLSSLSANKNNTSFSYILRQIVKIMTPVALVYVINSILLPYTTSYNNVSINHINIMRLSLPEGTDIWFIKIILFDYITTFLLFKIVKKHLRLLLSITIVQVLLIVVLYICKFGAYWYVSNLCFVFGASYTLYAKLIKKYIGLLALILTTCYICMINGIISAPIQIINNIVFCIITIYYFSNKAKWPKWLQFIGKNSLYYYLFNIPIMWLIPSGNIHFSVYFIANIIFTTIFILLYKKVNKLIKTA